MLVVLDPKTSDCLRYCSNIVEPGISIFYIPSDKAEVTPLTNERENIFFLKRMVQLSEAELRKYICTSDQKVISVLCECLQNVIRGNVKVRIDNLQQYENMFRIVLRIRTSLDKNEPFY